MRPLIRSCARVVAIALLAGAGARATAAQEETRPTELVVAYSSKRLTLDPLHTFTAMESQLFTGLYEGLLVADPITLEPRPGVASRWETTDDGRTWRFYLRSNARYSNGDRVRASDFVDSWRRMIDPAAKAEYSFLFDVIKGARAWRQGTLRDPAGLGFRAVSDDVLEVALEKPASHFLVLLTHIAFVPLHPSYLKAKQSWDDARTLVSNGPFSLSSRSDAELVLAKNRFYWDAGAVGLEKIRVRFIDDVEKATDEYLAGRVQWSTIGDQQKLTDPDQVEASAMFATSYFFFTCDAPPWSDWRVRRALALLLPWDTIRSRDLFFPTSRLVPSMPSYPEATGITASDPEGARKLLAQAGFPEGKGLPKLVIKVFDSSLGPEMAQAIAAVWKDALSLEVEVRALDAEDYTAEVRKRDQALALTTWIGDYPDPLTFLQLFITGSNLNDAGFSDPDYDAAVEEATGLLDRTKRYRRLADAEEILLSKAAVLPINHYAAVDFINLNEIDGWYPNPLDIHPFKSIRFKTHRAPANVAIAPLATALPPG